MDKVAGGDFAGYLADVRVAWTMQERHVAGGADVARLMCTRCWQRAPVPPAAVCLTVSGARSPRPGPCRSVRCSLRRCCWRNRPRAAGCFWSLFRRFRTPTVRRGLRQSGRQQRRVRLPMAPICCHSSRHVTKRIALALRSAVATSAGQPARVKSLVRGPVPHGRATPPGRQPNPSRRLIPSPRVSLIHWRRRRSSPSCRRSRSNGDARPSTSSRAHCCPGARRGIRSEKAERRNRLSRMLPWADTDQTTLLTNAVLMRPSRTKLGALSRSTVPVRGFHRIAVGSSVRIALVDTQGFDHCVSFDG